MAELDGKYVNEQNHQDTKAKLKKIGIILIAIGASLAVVGIVLVIVGFVSFSKPIYDDNPNAFYSSGASMAMFVCGSFLLVFGFPCLGYGIYATFFANAREIASYGATAVTPVIGETINYVKDSVSSSEKINEKDDLKQENKTNFIKCLKCGAENDETNKFCENCGSKLVKSRVCPKCNSKFDKAIKFCPNCGAKLKDEDDA